MEPNGEPIPKCLIMEDNKYKQYWDLYIVCLIMYVALIVPYRLGFDLEDTNRWKIWSYVVDASFGVDIILTFFTSYFDAEMN